MSDAVKVDESLIENSNQENMITSQEPNADPQQQSNNETSDSKPRFSRSTLLTIGIVSAILILSAIIVIIVLVTTSNNNNNNSSNSSSTASSSCSTCISLANGYIESDQGLMRGKVIKKVSNDNSTWIYTFLGVRYAYSTADELRFTSAVLYNESYGDDDYYDARDFSNSCPQVSSVLSEFLYGTPNEDCLFLNIYTPYIPDQSRPEWLNKYYSNNNNSNSNNNNPIASVNNISYNVNNTQLNNMIDESELLPVMIWIHGGGFTSGSAQFYDSKTFVQNSNNNIIIVTINYRLGIFGFLQMDSIYNENINKYGNTMTSYGGLNGIYDQYTAILWVKKYIKRFGGNPNKITIFGESAGGLSICGMLISETLAKLWENDRNNNNIFGNGYQLNSLNFFDNVIIQSGSCVGPWQSLTFDDGITFSKIKLVNNSVYGNLYNNLTRLRELSMNELIENVQCQGNCSWLPSVDNYYLKNTAYDIYYSLEDGSNGTYFNVSNVIWGYNSMDGFAGWPTFSGDFPKSIDEFTSYLEYYINDTWIVNELVSYYYNTSYYDNWENNVSIAWWEMNSDLCLACPSYEAADILNSQTTMHDSNNNNDSPKQFVYEFRGPTYPYLVPHASEIVTLFDITNVLISNYFRIEINESLTKSMQNAWIEFGLLHNNTQMENENNGFNFTVIDYNGFKNTSVKWFEYDYQSNNDNNNGSVMIFANTIKDETNYKYTFRNGACKFWKENVDFNTRYDICVHDSIPT